MAAFQVVFLEIPQVGRSVAILYNGQRGTTDPIASVQLLPNQPDIYQITTTTGNEMTGPVQATAQNAQPSAPFQNAESSARSSGGSKPNTCCFGCLGLIVLIFIMFSLSANNTSSVPSEQGSSSNTGPSNIELVSNIQISNAKLTDSTSAANGKPIQVISCTITNNNDVPVYAVDGTYRLTLDGSGILEPAGVKDINYCIHASKLEPHSSFTMPDKEGFCVITETQGRCTKAEIIVTNVETSDWNK